MRYNVGIKASAIKNLEKLPIEIQNKLRSIISSFEINPRPVGVKKLKTYSNLWRVRMGDYRIIYHIRDDKLIVLVVAVGARENIYKVFRGSR